MFKGFSHLSFQELYLSVIFASFSIFSNTACTPTEELAGLRPCPCTAGFKCCFDDLSQPICRAVSETCLERRMVMAADYRPVLEAHESGDPFDLAKGAPMTIRWLGSPDVIRYEVKLRDKNTGEFLQVGGEHLTKIVQGRYWLEVPAALLKGHFHLLVEVTALDQLRSTSSEGEFLVQDDATLLDSLRSLKFVDVKGRIGAANDRDDTLLTIAQYFQDPTLQEPLSARFQDPNDPRQKAWLATRLLQASRGERPLEPLSEFANVVSETLCTLACGGCGEESLSLDQAIERYLQEDCPVSHSIAPSWLEFYQGTRDRDVRQAMLLRLVQNNKSLPMPPKAGIMTPTADAAIEGEDSARDIVVAWSDLKSEVEGYRLRLKDQITGERIPLTSPEGQKLQELDLGPTSQVRLLAQDLISHYYLAVQVAAYNRYGWTWSDEVPFFRLNVVEVNGELARLGYDWLTDSWAKDHQPTTLHHSEFRWTTQFDAAIWGFTYWYLDPDGKLLNGRYRSFKSHSDPRIQQQAMPWAYTWIAKATRSEMKNLGSTLNLRLKQLFCQLGCLPCTSDYLNEEADDTLRQMITDYFYTPGKACSMRLVDWQYMSRIDLNLSPHRESKLSILHYMLQRAVQTAIANKVVPHDDTLAAGSEASPCGADEGSCPLLKSRVPVYEATSRPYEKIDVIQRKDQHRYRFLCQKSGAPYSYGSRRSTLWMKVQSTGRQNRILREGWIPLVFLALDPNDANKLRLPSCDASQARETRSLPSPVIYMEPDPQSVCPLRSGDYCINDDELWSCRTTATGSEWTPKAECSATPDMKCKVQIRQLVKVDGKVRMLNDECAPQASEDWSFDSTVTGRTAL